LCFVDNKCMTFVVDVVFINHFILLDDVDYIKDICLSIYCIGSSINKFSHSYCNIFWFHLIFFLFLQTKLTRREDWWIVYNLFFQKTFTLKCMLWLWLWKDLVLIIHMNRWTKKLIKIITFHQLSKQNYWRHDI
jgi:hypothetical protein